MARRDVSVGVDLVAEVAEAEAIWIPFMLALIWLIELFLSLVGTWATAVVP